MKNLTSNTGLAQAIILQQGEVISLVGGGGKTTLMFALARELVTDGHLVITTTTTVIQEPLPGQTPLLLIEKDEEKLLELVSEHIMAYRHVTLAMERLFPEKLKGIRPELVLKLGDLEKQPYIIVEADGAAQRPLKAPSATEPVLPPNTTLVIPVIGIDALGSPLNELNVFRAGIAARLLGSPIGRVISAEDITTLLTHTNGITRGTPENARVIPFINKIETAADLERGTVLAEEILKHKHPRIKQVILGSARSVAPIVKIITEKQHDRYL
ncbi:selenium cofactor biosynthesis protein YqeC [Chloroflexota bacterium]